MINTILIVFLSVKGRKLEIPSFDGSDPDGWILRVELYFTLNRLSQEEKIDVSFIAFEGAALKWFQWENHRHPISRWEDLRKLTVRQFRSASVGSLCEQFLAVKQEGTVDEFKMKFVELAGPLEGISEEVFMSLLNPATLEEAMELAVKIEIKNVVIAKEKTKSGTEKSDPVSYINQNVVRSTNSMNNSNVGANSVAEYKKLSDQEVQQRRALGLCYRCDEKFSPGNRCKKKELNVLLVQEEEIVEPAVNVKEDSMLNTVNVSVEDPEIEVQLSSVLGLTNPKTLKMEGLRIKRSSSLSIVVLRIISFQGI